MGKQLAFPGLCGLLAENPTKLSQAMHNAGYKSLGLNFSYHAFQTADTEQALAAMRELGIRGLSLTIPHKVAAVPFVDSQSEEVKKIGATNTVVNDGEKLTAHNTDVVGIREALLEKGFSAAGSKIVILGGGGAVRAAVIAVEEMGANDITIVVRNKEKAQSLADTFSVNLLSLEEAGEVVFSDASLLINGTPIGTSAATTESSYPFELEWLRKGQFVFDMVTADTFLLEHAAKSGATTVHGLRMLLFQALEQFKLFTGEEAPKEAMEKALYEESEC